MDDHDTSASKADMERLENRMEGLNLHITRNEESINRVDRRTEAIGDQISRLESRIQSGFQDQNEMFDRVLALLVNVEKRLTAATDEHEGRLRKLEALIH